MICVDPLRKCIPNPRWRWSESCHMYSDVFDDEELHAFARKIGLKREWFQEDTSLPHYDLTATRRRRAIRSGAHEVTTREIVEAIRRYRQTRKSAS